MNDDLELYQTSPNAVWYTDRPIFCSLSKKQIRKGIEVKINDSDDSIIYDIESFYTKVISKLFLSNDSILIRLIESNANLSKDNVKKQRSKMNLRLRFEVLKRDKFKCKSCGKNASQIELVIDHIIPVSKGGLTEISNLQCLCVDCNSGKSNIF